MPCPAVVLAEEPYESMPLDVRCGQGQSLWEARAEQDVILEDGKRFVAFYAELPGGIMAGEASNFSRGERRAVSRHGGAFVVARQPDVLVLTGVDGVEEIKTETHRCKLARDQGSSLRHSDKADNDGSHSGLFCCVGIAESGSIVLGMCLAHCMREASH